MFKKSLTISALWAALIGLAACGGASERSDDVPDIANAEPAVQTPTGEAPPKPSSFEGMDADGNKSVSAAEHNASASAMFAAMDGDSNGTVTPAEMDAAQSKLGGSTRMDSKAKIAAVDANGDGALTVAEHKSASEKIFAKMDSNRSGDLNEAEFAEGHKALK